MTWRLLIFGLIVFPFALTLGCEPEVAKLPETYRVSGTVTLDGEPLPKGTIAFEGENDVAKGLVSATSEIIQGKYEVQARAGENTIKIRVRVPDGPVDATGATPLKESIPARYNSASTLKKTVVADGANTFDFDLTSTPDPEPEPKPMTPAPK